MDDSSDFQEKKKCNAGPKKVQKVKQLKPKRPPKRLKGQKDIRALIQKDNALVSYSKEFDQVCKKSGLDVDSEQLQLAIALSKSLCDSETKSGDIEDNTHLNSQERVAKIRLTLQEYGFKVKKVFDAKTKEQGRRKKFNKQYKLLLVSNEEKIQNISDRYAEVLARNIFKSPKKHNKSSLKNDCDEKHILNKATNILYEDIKNDDIFYVHNLFQKPLFKSCLLRDWGEIPGRPVSPKREVNNINFDNIHCTQEELDYILSGSIHTAQSIVEKKHILVNLNKIEDKNSVKVLQPDTTNHEIQNIISIEIDSEYNKDIDMELNNSMLKVTHMARSVSPDLFDDEISINDTINSIKNTQENVSKNYNGDYMDLTECVNIVPFVNKNLSLNRKNVTNRTNDIMEITECVPTTSRFCKESIDLTQYCHLGKKAISKSENLIIDLTQHFNTDCGIPVKINTDDEESLNETIIIKDFESKETNKTILKDDYLLICDDGRIEDKSKLLDNSKNNLSNYPTIDKFKVDSNNLNSNHDVTQFAKDNELPIVDGKSKRKVKSLNKTIIDDIEVKILSEEKFLKTKKMLASSIETCTENIDLTQNIFYSTSKKSSKYYPEEDNLNIDLTQSLSPDDLPAEDGMNDDKSLNATTVIIDDNTKSEKNKEITCLHNPAILFCDENKINEKIKPIINDNNVHNDDDVQINQNKTSNNFMNGISDNINSCIKNQNIDLTQSSNSYDEPAIENEIKENLSKKTLPIEVFETNSHIDSEETNLQHEKEINKSNDCEENSYNYDDYIYNNSLDFDYGNAYSDNELHNTENSYKDNVPSCSYINSNKSSCMTNNLNSSNSDKNIDKAENVSVPLNSSIETKDNMYVKNNIGKIDNISIDYDELFDEVASSCKSVSITSLKSIISNKSAKEGEDFELSDKELNYSLHQSKNFDIGGLSIIDNVPDFTRSIKENSRQSLNRSLSESNLRVESVNKMLKYASETSTPVLKKGLLQEVQQTPKSNEYIIKTNNVTPMMDYESMTSPERNRELEKYGLKPFKRKRAIQLLTHLYNQTHPIVESCDKEEFSSPIKKRKLNDAKTSKTPEKPMKSPRKLFANLETEINKENIIYEVTKVNPDIKELKCEPEDWVFQKREKTKVHSCKVPLHIAFHNYVSCRQLLREAILIYEPINIDVVHKDLVACGYRYNPKDLLKFMDKKCITVKTVDNNARNRKS